jgi:hypothetical protein
MDLSKLLGLSKTDLTRNLLYIVLEYVKDRFLIDIQIYQPWIYKWENHNLYCNRLPYLYALLGENHSNYSRQVHCTYWCTYLPGNQSTLVLKYIAVKFLSSMN